MPFLMTMPSWLVNIWTLYKDRITPILVTILLALLTWVAIKIRSDAKLNKTKTDLQIDYMKQISEKKDMSSDVEALAKIVNGLAKKLDTLGEVFGLAFLNSGLSPEIKENVSALLNKIKFGSEDELLKNLNDQNQKLKEELQDIKNQIEQQIVIDNESSEPVTRIRR